MPRNEDKPEDQKRQVGDTDDLDENGQPYVGELPNAAGEQMLKVLMNPDMATNIIQVSSVISSLNIMQRAASKDIKPIFKGIRTIMADTFAHQLVTQGIEDIITNYRVQNTRLIEEAKLQEIDARQKREDAEYREVRRGSHKIEK